LIKGFPTTTRTTTTTTKQNVDPAVYYVYSRVKNSTTTERRLRPRIRRSGLRLTTCRTWLGR
jgi:hypothetical protein